MPESGPLAGAPSSFGKTTPAAFNFSMTLMLRRSLKKSTTDLAVSGPTSWTPRSSSSLASMSLSTLPNLLASTLAMCSPTPLMPRAKMRRSSAGRLLFSMASRRLEIDLSFHLARILRLSGRELRVYVGDISHEPRVDELLHVPVPEPFYVDGALGGKVPYALLELGRTRQAAGAVMYGLDPVDNRAADRAH